MEETRPVSIIGILCYVGVAYQPPVFVRPCCRHEGIPDRILPYQLLGETMKHIPEKAHGGTVGVWPIVVAIDVKVQIDPPSDGVIVEMAQRISEYDGSIPFPYVPTEGPSKPAENSAAVEFKGRTRHRGMTIDDQALGLGHHMMGLQEPVQVIDT